MKESILCLMIQRRDLAAVKFYLDSKGPVARYKLMEGDHKALSTAVYVGDLDMLGLLSTYIEFSDAGTEPRVRMVGTEFQTVGTAPPSLGRLLMETACKYRKWPVIEFLLARGCPRISVDSYAKDQDELRRFLLLGLTARFPSVKVTDPAIWQLVVNQAENPQEQLSRAAQELSPAQWLEAFSGQHPWPLTDRPRPIRLIYDTARHLLPILLSTPLNSQERWLLLNHDPALLIALIKEGRCQPPMLTDAMRLLLRDPQFTNNHSRHRDQLLEIFRTVCASCQSWIDVPVHEDFARCLAQVGPVSAELLRSAAKQHWYDVLETALGREETTQQMVDEAFGRSRSSKVHLLIGEAGYNIRPIKPQDSAEATTQT